MVKVLEAKKTPLAWRATDPRLFETLCKLGPTQAITDGVVYEDRYEAYKVVEAYRVLLRRYRPNLRLRCRVAHYDRGKYRWFVRVEPRSDRTG